MEDDGFTLASRTGLKRKGRVEVDESNIVNEKCHRFAAPKVLEPVKWWYARRAQFPRLSQFARDIHTIPGKSYIISSLKALPITSLIGSAVAVERIFSGGRDTIALWRASLQPGTISTLMIVKQWLKTKHAK